MTTVPAAALSETLTANTGWLNRGALSLISRTLITMLAVPERGGTPPSTAVKIKLWTACSSRSPPHPHPQRLSMKTSHREGLPPICPSALSSCGTPARCR
uniref:Uncharacterized protein n=1 Tax=Sander lucioperca TaxID=283035 RepID=A0A8C9XLE1_SANLU